MLAEEEEDWAPIDADAGTGEVEDKDEAEDEEEEDVEGEDEEGEDEEGEDEGVVFERTTKGELGEAVAAVCANVEDDDGGALLTIGVSSSRGFFLDSS